MVDGVGTSPAVFTWPKDKEESNIGQVSSGLLVLYPPLTGRVKGLEEKYWDGLYFGRRRVLLCVRRELPAQAKVDFPQLILAMTPTAENFSWWNEGTFPWTIY